MKKEHKEESEIKHASLVPFLLVWIKTLLWKGQFLHYRITEWSSLRIPLDPPGSNPLETCCQGPCRESLRGGDSTTFPGSLCQCSTTHTVEVLADGQRKSLLCQFMPTVSCSGSVLFVLLPSSTYTYWWNLSRCLSTWQLITFYQISKHIIPPIIINAAS